MKIKFLIGLLTITLIVNAQSDFRTGYVIKPDMDTLYGTIDYRGDILMGERCKYKATDTSAVITYTPNDIIAYRFIEGKYFVTKKVKGTNLFLEFLIKGQLNVYYLRTANGDQYFMEKAGSEMVELPFKEGIKQKDDKQYFYTSTKHIGVLKYLMQDAPEMQSQISTMGEPKHSNLIKLAKDYHNIVCTSESCIVFEKMQPFIKVNPEIVFGAVNFNNEADNSDKFYLQGGVAIHLWLPRVNEKIYFKTGLLYAQPVFDNETISLYKFPLHIEYVYPKGTIRPRLSYGINVYKPFYQSVSLNGGVNIKLNEELFFSLSSELEFYPYDYLVLFPSKEILAFSLNGGLYFKF